MFLPQDSTFLSFGVVKVPDAEQAGAAPPSSGSRASSTRRTPSPRRADRFSAFPDAKNPAISMLVYAGDLGLDSGEPQSVYALDKKKDWSPS